MLTIALTLEVFFLGMSCSTALASGGARRSRIVIAILALAAALLGGAFVGAMFLASASAVLLDAVLAFGVAALLYLVIEELLVEAHDVPETAFQTAMFFVGFITLLVIEMML